jgi:hypothetical protein
VGDNVGDVVGNEVGGTLGMLDGFSVGDCEVASKPGSVGATVRGGVVLVLGGDCDCTALTELELLLAPTTTPTTTATIRITRTSSPKQTRFFLFFHHVVAEGGLDFVVGISASPRGTTILSVWVEGGSGSAPGTVPLCVESGFSKAGGSGMSGRASWTKAGADSAAAEGSGISGSVSSAGIAPFVAVIGGSSETGVSNMAAGVSRGSSSGSIKQNNPQPGIGGSSSETPVSSMAAGVLSTNSGSPSLADVGFSAWLDAVSTILTYFPVINFIILFSGACRWRLDRYGMQYGILVADSDERSTHLLLSVKILHDSQKSRSFSIGYKKCRCWRPTTTEG